jgi:hypothetical protein
MDFGEISFALGVHRVVTRNAFSQTGVCRTLTSLSSLQMSQAYILLRHQYILVLVSLILTR